MRSEEYQDTDTFITVYGDVENLTDEELVEMEREARHVLNKVFQERYRREQRAELQRLGLPYPKLP